MSRTPRSLSLLLTALAALSALAAACGLPEDDRPHLIAAEDAPLDLVPTTAPPDATPEAGEETVDVYFLTIDQTQLRAAERPVGGDDVGLAVDALLAGLTEDERVDLSNAIPQGVVRRSSTLVDGVLTLDLGPAGEGGLQSVQGLAQQRAFAQLVWTATAVPGIVAVRFLIDGLPIDAPTDGEALPEVNRANYLSLSPPSEGQG